MNIYNHRKEKLQKIFSSGMLYFVSEEELSHGRRTEEIVYYVLQAGVQMIQLRDKGLSKKERLQKAHTLRKMTRDFDALLIVDDEVDIAYMSGADGVHLGQEDLPLSEVRKYFPDLLLGSSTHDQREIEESISLGADYINIGPIYPTQTKDWQGDYLGADNLRRLSERINIPFTVMGGIKEEHIQELVNSGARIFAMVTAVSQSEGIYRTAKSILQNIRREVGNFKTQGQ